ncbi:hypothetical protein Y032_0100g3299 [Ancylostoma ceylanicum]|nr:hypothetical protein Y032_0100g3299 [Ancylostoma ceylanicum]
MVDYFYLPKSPNIGYSRTFWDLSAFSELLFKMRGCLRIQFTILPRSIYDSGHRSASEALPTGRGVSHNGHTPWPGETVR